MFDFICNKIESILYYLSENFTKTIRWDRWGSKDTVRCSSEDGLHDWTGTYKDDKPWTGEFIIDKNGTLHINEYENGHLISSKELNLN